MTKPTTSNDQLRADNAARDIRQGMFVELNSLAQWVTIRGNDRANPVLLVITGPGVAFSSMAPLFAPWEQDFTLVQWDQPGAGATAARHFAGLDAELGARHCGPLTLDRLANDAVTLAQMLCKKLDVPRMSLLGVSAGTIIALKMLKRAPHLFSAYVGAGQVTSWARQDRLSYEIVLERARLNADRDGECELLALGPPPYANAAADAVKARYAGAWTPAEQQAFGAIDPEIVAQLQQPRDDADYLPAGLPRLNTRELALRAYEEMRDEIVAFDATELGSKFDVPMYFFQGELDAYTVTSEVEAFASGITAPVKRVVHIPGAGHSAFLLRDTFLRLLKQHL